MEPAVEPAEQGASVAGAEGDAGMTAVAEATTGQAAPPDEASSSAGPAAPPPTVRPAPPPENLPPPPADVAYVIVNEAGASVYSTSEIGREEFPDYDATLRGAISIGRRLLDPLSELVKIEAPNLGVGLYQHDVKAKHLRTSLDAVVESCVNFVGVDVNTASPALLQYVSRVSARRRSCRQRGSCGSAAATTPSMPPGSIRKATMPRVLCWRSSGEPRGT
jgi:uncharacterized protein